MKASVGEETRISGAGGAGVSNWWHPMNCGSSALHFCLLQDAVTSATGQYCVQCDGTSGTETVFDGLLQSRVEQRWRPARREGNTCVCETPSNDAVVTEFGHHGETCLVVKKDRSLRAGTQPYTIVYIINSFNGFFHGIPTIDLFRPYRIPRTYDSDGDLSASL